MKYLILILCFLSLEVKNDKNVETFFPCQSYYDQSLKRNVFTSVDEMPLCPGGMRKLSSFFDKVKYERSYNNSSWQHKVDLTFVIDEKGCIINASIDKKKTEEYSKLDLEYIRAAKKMPKWKPAKCNGKVVPFKFSTTFRITPQ
ncbi:hypothetical protein QFZ20_003593 [Flavobacterium sp. W4I14]|nr:hypothetical protein [Flavobacterium sp. W4I14]